MIEVKVVRAIDHPRLCKRFLEGHQRVLKIYDIANITSNTVEWAFNPNTLLILITKDGNAVAGARIQKADGLLELPIEEAVKEMDPSIHQLINSDSEAGGTGEFCGLWNSREGAKSGVGGFFLARVGLAVASGLQIKSLYALCAPPTVPVGQKTGFSVVENLGNNGTFYYPKLDLLATAMKVPDILTLERADEEERMIIFNMRSQPCKIEKVVSKRGEVEVSYNLTF